jgi:protein TonB
MATRTEITAVPAPRRAATGVRLGRWLLGSLLAHLLMVIGWHSAPPFPGHRETVLSVSLDGNHLRPAPSSRLEHTARNNPRTETPPTAIGPGPATPAQEPAETRRSSSLPAADGHGRSPEPAAARIQASLLANLAHHFDYPMLARLRGWQGTVLIGLDVEADGFLRQIHLARSSGYDVLDQSAIESVRRIGRLPDMADWPDGRRVQIRLPVIYQLTDR